MAWPGIARVGRKNDGTSVRAAVDRKDGVYPAAVGRKLRDPDNIAKKAALAVGEKLRGAVKVKTSALVEGRTFGPEDHILHLSLRYLPNARQTFLEIVQRAAMNGDSDSAAIMKVFDGLTEAQQRRIDLDTLAHAAGVLPNRILGTVVDHSVQMGRDVAEMITGLRLPELIDQTHKSALRIDGDHAEIALRDRHALLGHQKMIPVPKGASVHVHANAHAQAAAAASSQPSVPTFAESIDAANVATREVQQLGPAEDAEYTE